MANLFIASLFLELLVNGEALVIRFRNKTAFPAVAEWVGSMLPFVELTTYERRADFGIQLPTR